MTTVAIFEGQRFAILAMFFGTLPLEYNDDLIGEDLDGLEDEDTVSLPDEGRHRLESYLKFIEEEGRTGAIEEDRDGLSKEDRNELIDEGVFSWKKTE